MAKANLRAISGRPMHSKSDMPHKIPIKDRKAFMGTNTEKWVSKKTWEKYQKWIKDGRPPR